ncbi:armadillo-type protein [Chaetomium sp. MPI-SDFR-AT-0129]|nr:armadillo-type protein [Chaetomium sp. MPI-SDFR-AT-0129]
MATDSPLTLRTEFFQQLKTHCVPLSRLTLAPKDVPTDFKLVLHHLSSLTTLWTTQSTHNPTILDSNLASYVFFPLSHLLQDRERYPARVVEEVLRLVRGLVKYGWKGGIEGGLWRQLVLLMGLLIGGVTGKREREMSEEGVVEGFRTLGVLLGVVGPGQLEGMQTQTQTEQAGGENNKTKLALAQAVTVILDGITESDVVQVQVEAAECLWTVFSTIKDRSVLAQFFPGTVSALAKLLSPPQANRTQRRLLTRCLEILQLVLTAVLGDLGVRSLLRQLETIKESERTSPVDRGQTAEVSSQGGEPLTASWLRATAAQVKIALAAVLKLRAHDSDDVQSALHKLCITLLDECHASLADCRIILVETAMMLEDPDANNTTNNQRQLQTRLQDLITIHPSLTNPVQSALYTWITGLPRVMQASDERVKQLAVRSILRGTKLAAALQMDSSTLDDALGDSLRDSIVTLVRGSKPRRIVDDGEVDFSSSTGRGALVVRDWAGEKAVYAPVLLDAEGLRTTREEIGSLIANIGSAAQQVTIAMAMLGHVRDSEGVEQIASFWLAFELIKATYSQSADLDEMFDLSSLEESRHQEDAFRELYDFSASVLAAHSDSVAADWRLEAIALEVAAFAAARLKVDFQPELIDVLYPVTTFVGSGVPQLRKHAITTLDIVAASCGYASVSDLIVENADYMVNSISLRLNTFDISPASTKVLTMVIRLTGPRLIPYLDDVVAAIFAALDNYHGYPVFVESLFAVLSEVVTQGVKSDELLLGDSSKKNKVIDHRKRAPTSQGIPGILQTLTARLDRAARSAKEREQQAATLASHPHPQKPWGPPKDQATSLLDKLTNPDADQDQDPDQEVQSSTDPDETSKTPTQTLLTKILSLTQNHLTTPSPTLRKSLLHLITTVSPALSRDEDAFLPLVHAVWPVAITRLFDRETYVAVAACEALGGLCEGAGDFLGGRWRGVWWDGEKGGGKEGSGKDGSVTGWMRGVREGVRRGQGKKGGIMSYGNGIRTGTGTRLVGDEIVIPGLHHDNNDLEHTPITLSTTTTTTPPTTLTLTRHTTHSSTTHSSDSNTYIRPFTQPSQLWNAALALLTSIATYVKLEDDMFDDILDLVADVLPQQPALRRALEVVNADAVWLVLYERGVGEIIRERPVWEEEGGDREGEGGLEFVSLKEVVVV